MKRFMSLMLVVMLSFVLFNCGSDKTINGKSYTTYGLINQDDVKNPEIKYRLVPGNLIWGIILIETIIAPVYFFGYSLWEPVSIK
jgi:hypothetical protein